MRGIIVRTIAGSKSNTHSTVKFVVGSFVRRNALRSSARLSGINCIGAKLVVLMFAVFLGCSALAQPFPNKPIRIIIPYAPGGSPDTLGRTLAQASSDALGQQIVVENRPGGGGTIAAEAVMRVAADGYTLLIGDSSVYAVNPSLNPKLPYEMLRDFAPVTLAVSSPMFLAVNAGLGVEDVKSFVALSQTKPGLPFGSSGNGTVHHLGLELMKANAKIDLTHVPYKGAGQSVPAVVAGDVGGIFAAINTLLPHARSSRIRILAIAAAERSQLMPQIPTMAEAGVQGVDLFISIGVFAPAKTPRDVVERLSIEFNKALALPEVRQRFFNAGIDPIGSTPERYAEAIRTELVHYGNLVRSVAAKMN
ncbi:MAG: tripartite tricarboxylate transporter substrate binding protein [Betaproteobacteria bacterium]|nr:tripartite tricarboxylate transporter substrate binding protein [Betaproteobacteria bacterium]